MTGYLNIILRLTIWFLLTADLSWANILIGVGVALLLPRGATNPGRLKDWLRTLWEVVVAIPQAYKEAFEIMIWPHNHEIVTVDRAKPRRTPSLIFLDIFLITFTPKTIVQRYREQGWYEVHGIQRRESP
ncbi:Na+/H+ antiporter subunit E [Nodosilinea nodulosa]|uniref:Na+/H+ antiporter subunit E n=1 Tax=Nodosilinea nodulosa TaxID=416001 RepID=UPI00030EE371|nr:Na+/H+ antiporter subunit E [Nodosilinea nodulosa]